MDKYTFKICEATALGLDYYYMATRNGNSLDGITTGIKTVTTI